MPIFVLYVQAEMENVAEFWAPSETTWNFDVKKSTSDEERKGVVIDADEEHDVPNTKNTTANFMLKFDGDKNFSYLKVLQPGGEGWPKNLQLKPQTGDDTEPVPWLAVECRGMEPVKWTPIGPYCAKGPGGSMFDEVGFVDGDDWCEYDEKAESEQANMTIGMNIKYEFRLHKSK